MSIALVSTTIFVPKLLEAYFEAAKNGNEDVITIIVGDKKTPPETATFCAELQSRYGMECEYLGVEQQIEYMTRFSELSSHIPWNCVERRVIGMLRAYERGADPIIILDDDNFLADNEYFKQLHSMGQQVTLPSMSTHHLWVNACDLLKEENGHRFYHRGFPIGEAFLVRRRRGGDPARRCVSSAIVACRSFGHSQPNDCRRISRDSGSE